MIKPIGLVFPISLAFVALALRHVGRRRTAVVVLLSSNAWPVAHIAKLGPLAVIVHVALAVSLGTAAWSRRTCRPAGRSSAGTSSGRARTSHGPISPVCSLDGVSLAGANLLETNFTRATGTPTVGDRTNFERTICPDGTVVSSTSCW